MVEPGGVTEVRSVDGELVVRVELGFHCVIACPGVAGAAFENEHAVVDGWAVEWTECVDLWRWSILCCC